MRFVVPKKQVEARCYINMSVFLWTCAFFFYMFEQERWCFEHVCWSELSAPSSVKKVPAKDTVADGVSNSFLRLLDKSQDKLKERMDKLEAQLEQHSPKGFLRFNIQSVRCGSWMILDDLGWFGHYSHIIYRVLKRWQLDHAIFWPQKQCRNAKKSPHGICHRSWTHWPHAFLSF